MILQWGIVGAVFPGTNQKDVRNVNDWIAEITKQGDRLVISSLVIGQLLVAQPLSIHEALLASLERNYVIYSYNDAAARRFAQLHIAHIQQNKQAIKSIQQDTGRPSQSIKLDMMILGHALAIGVDAFYTCNIDDFKGLALNQIDVFYPMPKQPRLIGE
jgi:predicted nucleic acid-binding protein